MGGVEGLEEGAHFGAGRDSACEEVAPRNQGWGKDGFVGKGGELRLGEGVTVEFAVGGEAVKAVEVEFEADGGSTEDAAEGGFAHGWEFGKLHVVADSGGDGFDGLIVGFEAAEDGLGKWCAHVRVVGGADARGAIGGFFADKGVGFGDIVEKNCPNEGGVTRGRGQFQHVEGVIPDVALGVPSGILFATVEGEELVKKGGKKPGGAQELEGLRRVGGFAEGANKLNTDSLGTDAGEVGGFSEEGYPSLRVDLPLAGGGKPNGAEHSQAVFLKAAEGVAYGAEDAVAQVAFTTGVINEAVGKGVVEEGVGGEVAALGVVFGGVVGNGFGVAAVLVAAVTAKGGDVEGLLAHADKHNAKGFADADTVCREEGFDLVGGGVGGDIDIFDGGLAEGVTDAPSGKVSGVPCGVELLEYAARVGVEVGAGRVMKGQCRHRRFPKV